MIQHLAVAVTALVLTGPPILTGGGLDGGAAAVPVSGEGAPALSRVDAMVRQYLDEHDVPGATVAITKGSRLIWAKGYGYADASSGTLMQPETRSRIGSTSKVLTTIGAMQLAESGALDLDQHVYGSAAAPLWGADPGTTPGVVVTPDGVLEDPGAYFDAMVAGVDLLGETFPPSEHLDEWPSLPWALLNQAAYEQEVDTVLERASTVRVRNLLSHTAGLRKGGGDEAKEAAQEHFGTTADELTESQLHQGALMGMSGGPLFVLDPGTEWKYSNWGFAFAGQIIGAASEEGDYRQYIENHLLAPLGLEDVVPNNVSISELDALPHDADNVPYALDPDTVSRLLLATGGWSASARDLARVMCSIDGTSNHLRALQPETVDLMASDTEPNAAGLNPFGWDKYTPSSGELTKNGEIPGGSSRISKFLPGAFASDPDAEINVAVAINKGDSVPSAGLLRKLAEIAAQADVGADYDLFDPAYACYVEESLGLAVRPLSPPQSSPPSEWDGRRAG